MITRIYIHAGTFHADDVMSVSIVRLLNPAVQYDRIEDDYFAIMNHGQFFYGDHAHLKKGLPNHCHCNAAQFWAANKGRCQICTGYALSEDGIWRQHSWVVQPLTRSWRIWETTVKRIAYFGVIFDDAECERFCELNG